MENVYSLVQPMNQLMTVERKKSMLNRLYLIVFPNEHISEVSFVGEFMDLILKCLVSTQ